MESWANYSASLRILGDDLDLDSVTKDLGIQPTRMVRKGEVISRVRPPVGTNVWLYTVEDENDPEMALQRLLEILGPCKELLQSKYNGKFSVYLSCHSSLAQFGFTISPRIIEALKDVGGRLEVSILSWGEVPRQGKQSDKSKAARRRGESPGMFTKT